MRCIHCKQPLTCQLVTRGDGLRADGYVHTVGGGLIWQRCDKCKWSGSNPTPYDKCPNCGECGLAEDHKAEPERS